jgi:hypothetical protein
MPGPPVRGGFTAVLCTASRCGVGDGATAAGPLVDALRATVRASRLGVLVSTGCLVGEGVCLRRPAAPIVLVQPCDEHRRPTSAALRIGPLRTVADVDVLEAWLRAGRLDPELLPVHLLDMHRRIAARHE